MCDISDHCVWHCICTSLCATLLISMCVTLNFNLCDIEPKYVQHCTSQCAPVWGDGHGWCISCTLLFTLCATFYFNVCNTVLLVGCVTLYGWWWLWGGCADASSPEPLSPAPMLLSSATSSSSSRMSQSPIQRQRPLEPSAGASGTLLEPLKRETGLTSQ